MPVPAHLPASLIARVKGSPGIDGLSEADQEALAAMICSPIPDIRSRATHALGIMSKTPIKAIYDTVSALDRHAFLDIVDAPDHHLRPTIAWVVKEAGPVLKHRLIEHAASYCSGTSGLDRYMNIIGWIEKASAS
jgi:hypothetical protein